MSVPLVSVLLPVRNGEKYLQAALESVLSQTIDDFEIIVVDDRSTDSTREILINWLPKFAAGKLVTGPGSGISAALNAGLEQCSGKYVARMDADDLMHPQRLEEQVQVLLNEPEVIVVGTQIAAFRSPSTFVYSQRLPKQHAAIVERLCATGYAIAHPSAMYRRVEVLNAGGYRSETDGAEDRDLWLRLSELGQLRNLEKTLLFYRVHEAQATQSFKRQGKELGGSFKVASNQNIDFGNTWAWASWKRLHRLEHLERTEKYQDSVAKFELLFLRLSLLPSYLMSRYAWLRARGVMGDLLR